MPSKLFVVAAARLIFLMRRCGEGVRLVACSLVVVGCHGTSAGQHAAVASIGFCACQIGFALAALAAADPSWRSQRVGDDGIASARLGKRE